MGERRYSRSFLESINARMKFMTEKMSKRAAREWEKWKIKEYEKEHEKKPDHNNDRGYH
jgi:hypothetical protein